MNSWLHKPLRGCSFLLSRRDVLAKKMDHPSMAIRVIPGKTHKKIPLKAERRFRWNHPSVGGGVVHSTLMEVVEPLDGWKKQKKKHLPSGNRFFFP